MCALRIQPDARFNVLVTEDRPHDPGYWTHQLPRLLEPQGVAAYVVHTGHDAMSLADQLVIHAAVIDMATPLGEGEPVGDSPGASPAERSLVAELHRLATAAAEPAGLWLLELFRRLPNRPPVVVVHNNSDSQRQVDRLLCDALRLGAFSVLNKPVGLEQLLRVFQRLVDRQYRGAWPAPAPAPPRPPSDEPVG
jgi:CheY-like chemotaxis protein